MAILSFNMFALISLCLVLAFAPGIGAPVDQTPLYSRKLRLQLLKTQFHPLLSAKLADRVSRPDPNRLREISFAAEHVHSTRDLSKAMKSHLHVHNLHRLATFDGHKASAIRALFASQTSSKEKASLADPVVINTSARQQGLTGDRCSSNSSCQGNRICRIDFNLFCIPSDGLQRCTSDSDCVSGEVCADTDNDFCISSTAFGGENSSSSDSSGSGSSGSSDSGSSGSGSSDTTGGGSSDRDPPTTDPETGNSGSSLGGLNPGQDSEQNDNDLSQPCIAVKALQHVPRTQLVFEKDLLANVFCDELDSCATPGHIVRHRGKGMMMKSYCGLIGGCTRTVMHVNSPRYERGLVVSSGSEEMVFTAFSARYETVTEEAMLSFAVRLGL